MMKFEAISNNRWIATALLFSMLIASPGIDQKSAQAQDDLFDLHPPKGLERFLDTYRFTIEWGQPKTLDPSGRLELMSASADGPRVSVTRFQPGEQNVDILEVSVDIQSIEHQSKWPGNHQVFTATRGTMKSGVYKKLLHDVAKIDSAKLTFKDRGYGSPGYHEAWYQVNFFTERKPSVNMFWFGEGDSDRSGKRSKTIGAMLVCMQATGDIEMSDTELSDEDRLWASKMFARQWRQVDYWASKDERFKHGLIVLIGAFGNNHALSKLGRIIRHDKKPELVNHAINAVTRITGKDVRSKPVEEMDLEANKGKVLELIKETARRE